MVEGQQDPENAKSLTGSPVRLFYEQFRQRPTLPGGLPPSTIGAGGLNCRVRNGNGCISAAMATGNLVSSGIPEDSRASASYLIKPSAD